MDLLPAHVYAEISRNEPEGSASIEVVAVFAEEPLVKVMYLLVQMRDAGLLIETEDGHWRIAPPESL